MNSAAEYQFLIGWTQRLRRKVDAAFGQVGEVRFIRAGGQELVGILRREPNRETPRAALPRQ